MAQSTVRGDAVHESDLGAFVNEQLRSLGKRQADLAAESGFTPTSISDWLRGFKRPRPESIEALASALATIEGSVDAEGHPDPERVRVLRDRMLRAAGHISSSVHEDLLPENVRHDRRLHAILADLGRLDEETLTRTLAAMRAVVELALHETRQAEAAPARWPGRRQCPDHVMTLDLRLP
jgi:transcriptional regulator with XRE-family HTH domain